MITEGSAISFPFSFNDYGQINATSDQRTIWKDRVVLTVLTKFGERVVRPGFGSSLSSALFETESLAIEMAQTAIRIAFNDWLNSLKLIEANPVYEYETGSLVIPIVYLLPSGETDSVTLKTAIFNRSGDLLQELTNG